MELGLGNIYSKKKPTKNPLASDNTLSNSSRSSYSSKRLEQEKLAADMANQPEQKTLKSYFFDDFMESGIKFSAISPSFYDEPQKKIFTYNPEQLRHYLMPLFEHDLTACYDFWVWAKHISIVTYAVVLAIILTETAFPDTKIGSEDATIPSCPALTNLNICTLEVTMAESTKEFRFLIAFILASFVGSSVKIWYDRRAGYGSLVGNTKNCLVLVNSSISRKQDPLKARQHISRWLLMIYELAVLKARGHMDSDDAMEFLEELQLLQGGEWECMAPGERHTSVVYWIDCMLMRYVKEDVITHETGAMLASSVGNLRGVANDLMSSLFKDQPISYTALTGLLVKTNVIIFSTWKAVDWSIWMHTFGIKNLFMTQSRIWVDIIVLLAWNVSYTALYDLGYMLNNPFGNRRIDIPHEAISGGVHRFAEKLVKGGKNNNSMPPALSMPSS